jgi:hypothetical protein
VVVLFGCDTKEKERLRVKVDSLNVLLQASRQVEENMNEVGVLLDSIDASRKALQMTMVEGSPYADYVTRLKNINNYVKQTEERLTALEKSSKKSSKASQRVIKGLKADLEKQTAEIMDLQMKVAKEHEENIALWTKVNQKDSLLSMKDEVIKMRESDIVSLEKLVNDTQAENKVTVSNLYFEQARALEMAADRTQFKPRKKKETRREALELYKLSLSLGNNNAQQKIDELEKKLSLVVGFASGLRKIGLRLGLVNGLLFFFTGTLGCRYSTAFYSLEISWIKLKV